MYYGSETVAHIQGGSDVTRARWASGQPAVAAFKLKRRLKLVYWFMASLRNSIQSFHFFVIFCWWGGYSNILQ